MRRNAAKGCHAVTFSEIPPFLGLPSVHDKDGFWDPFFAACEETDTVVCMHIGSSSKMPSTSADAPPAVGSTLTYMNAAMSLTDWLMSGVFERFPTLTIAYSEGQIGWIPYVLERADQVWEDNRGWGGVADKVKRPPSEYYFEHVYGCFFDDAHGLNNIDAVGRDNVTFETDYPHSDSTWPHTQEGRGGDHEGSRPGDGRQDLSRQRDPAALARPARLNRPSTWVMERVCVYAGSNVGVRPEYTRRGASSSHGCWSRARSTSSSAAATSG